MAIFTTKTVRIPKNTTVEKLSVPIDESEPAYLVRLFCRRAGMAGQGENKNKLFFVLLSF